MFQVLFQVRRRSIAAVGLLAAGALVLAACGGGSSHSAGASTQPTTTTSPGRGRAFGAALTEFRDCMTGHGVTLPARPRLRGAPPSTVPGDTRPGDGSGGPGGGFGGGFGGNLAQRFAQTPPGQDGTKYQAAFAACRSKLPTGTLGPRNNSAFQAFRSCLQDHGVSLPASGGLAGVNRGDPKVQSALNTCRALLPAGGFGRDTTTSTSAPG